MLKFSEKCTGCGLCREVCPTGGENCTLCGLCAEVCTPGARAVSGKVYTIEQVMEQILADRAFYEKSGGGVTFSGGECMLQADFLAELLKACKTEGLSTALDTAGNVHYERFTSIILDADLILYDIKCVTPERHKEFTGVDNRLILENYRRLLAENTRLWVRVPVVPGFNDSPEELEKIRGFLAENRPEKLELLAYHDLGVSKQTALGMASPWQTQIPTEETMNTLRAYFAEAGL
jgi:pyruvate formate lyase activating enzyme